MSGMVRRDALKRDLVPAVVVLTDAEKDQLAAAAWRGGRGMWTSLAEIAAVERIVAARLAGGSDVS